MQINYELFIYIYASYTLAQLTYFHHLSGQILMQLSAVTMRTIADEVANLCRTNVSNENYSARCMLIFITCAHLRLNAMAD